MKKVISVAEAMNHIKDGMTIMYGGFMGVGTPEILIDGIVAKSVKELTLIGNDAAVPGKGVAKLISSGQVKSLIASHIGLNPEVGQLMNSGQLKVELIPQGTLAEQIRSGGAGIGGFLTATGLGTSVEEGKTKLEVGNKTYLLELPLRADVALIRGSIVDEMGNVYYRGTTQNFNPLVAMAADLVIVAAEKLVETGELTPEWIMTPSVFVDYIVVGEC
jgi:acetate CoA/acetoacetate CoA-transferase alpha subunit